MGIFDRVSEGLQRSRNKFKEQMNILLDRGPDLDDDFWETLEETLVLSDLGAPAAASIVERLQDQAVRQALPDAYAVLDLLKEHIAGTFTAGGERILGGEPALILFVGINGTGKTTTVGKIAREAVDQGRRVILGSADTFRAAAIEQLEVWSQRAQVEMVTRERGSDPASVCYDTIERAEEIGADLVLIDTAGRLHTSADLMRELEKVVSVVRKRSQLPVYTLLVIDATTGQNGLAQAREFNRALQLDGLIVTKLDGSAKGGIALAISHELNLPIVKIGVGEHIEDLRDFDPLVFAGALIGDFDDRGQEEEEFVAPISSDAEWQPDVITEDKDQGHQKQIEQRGETQEVQEVCDEASNFVAPVYLPQEAVEAKQDDGESLSVEEVILESDMRPAQFTEGDQSEQSSQTEEKSEAVKPRRKHFWEKWW